MRQEAPVMTRVPACPAFDSDSIPWIPLSPGESFKPLRFWQNGRALLLRLEPGTIVPRHRHLGDVHAFNVSGTRILLDTGEVVGPGGYVYEPVGNVDSWAVAGDEPVVVLIITTGAMEYLDPNGAVLRRDTPETLRARYVAFCDQQGIVPAELG